MSSSSTAGSSQYAASTGSATSNNNVATEHTQVGDGVSDNDYQNQLPIPTDLVLPCEFVTEGCSRTFGYDDSKAWIDHIITDHLRNELPIKAACWFCGTVIFDARGCGVGDDRRLNFHNRMEHIRKHFAEGKTIYNKRPDFHMFLHTHRQRVAFEDPYNQVGRLDESLLGARRQLTVSNPQLDNENSSINPLLVMMKRMKRFTGGSSSKTPKLHLAEDLQHSNIVQPERPNFKNYFNWFLQSSADEPPRYEGIFHSKDQGGCEEAEQIQEQCEFLDDSVDSSSLPSKSVSKSGAMIQPPAVEEVNGLLIQDCAALLCKDEPMMSHILLSASKDDIGLERMQTEFCKMLKRCALDLKAEAHTDHQRTVVRFVSSFSTNITRDVFSKLSTGVPDSGLRIPKSSQNIGNSPAEPAERDGDSGQDSTDEEAVEEELYDGSLIYLDQMERFILESVAYQNLHRRLRDFICPSLGSKLWDLVASWSKPGHRYYDHVIRYKLSNLVAEIQYIDSNTIRFDDNEESGYVVRIIEHFQNSIEIWIKERWD